MKKIVPFLLVSLMICPGLRAQVINYFTWDNSANERIADIGPNATNSGTLTQARPTGSGGSPQGLAPGSVTVFGNTILENINLVLGGGGIFNQDNIEYSIDYRRGTAEVNAGFFVRLPNYVGGPEFFLGTEYGKLTLRFAWDNGAGGFNPVQFTLLGYWPGDEIPIDNAWRNYSFAYDADLGEAILRVNGVPVWSLQTVPGAGLVWPTTPPIIGHESDNLGVIATIFDNALIQTPEPLPVEWGAFEGVQAQRRVRLDWETYSQLNFNYFEVEYAADGRSFRPIGRVSGPVATQEAQQYSFVHEQPQAGANYYRLRQVDLDGKVHYSQRIEVNFVLDAASPFIFYPNPVKDRLYIGINESDRQPTSLHVAVYDLSGRLLRQSKLEIAAQQLETYLDTEGIAPGLYLVQVSRQGRTAYHKMTK